ncbi:hypothetical protein KAI04_04015 [Candidatus Pacearchaeota archaeon]|nr:hypothetical protein [Candidatus Pacearchaeota archaeon]
MTEEYKLEDLEYDKGNALSDDEMNKLDGCRVPIASVEIIDDTSKYQDGKLLPDDQEISVKKIELTSAPFGTALIGRDIVHKERYNLKSKDGAWKVSLHEKSNTGQFLAKYGVDKFENAVSKEVVLVKKTNPETKRSWMKISI